MHSYTLKTKIITLEASHPKKNNLKKYLKYRVAYLVWSVMVSHCCTYQQVPDNLDPLHCHPCHTLIFSWRGCFSSESLIAWPVLNELLAPSFTVYSRLLTSFSLFPNSLILSFIFLRCFDYFIGSRMFIHGYKQIKTGTIQLRRNLLYVQGVF